MSYGTRDLGATGRGGGVLVNPADARLKPGGATIDWDKVTAVTGQNEKLTLVIDATGGTFTASFGGQTTAALANDVAVAALETALEGLSTIGVGNVLVTGSPENYVIEFVEDLRHANVGAITIDGALLTGGAGATLTVTQSGAAAAEVTLADGSKVAAGDKYILAGTVMARITATGKYAPADTTASDGRETVTAAVRGERFILDRTMIKSLHGDHTGQLFDAGTVWKARLQIGGSGQPTEAHVEAMLPGVTFHSS